MGLIFPISRCHFHLILSHEIFQLNFLYDLLSAIPKYKAASRIHTFQFVQLLKPSWGIQGGQKMKIHLYNIFFIFKQKNGLTCHEILNGFCVDENIKEVKNLVKSSVSFSTKSSGPFSTTLYSNSSPWHGWLNSN